MGAGPTARVGSLWITPSWVVGFAPALKVYPTKDIIGLGVSTSVTKSGEREHQLRFWIRENLFSDDLEVSEADARLVMAAAGERLPWAAIGDVNVFEKSWRNDRKARAQEADERRTGARRG